MSGREACHCVWGEKREKAEERLAGATSEQRCQYLWALIADLLREERLLAATDSHLSVSQSKGTRASSSPLRRCFTSSSEVELAFCVLRGKCWQIFTKLLLPKARGGEFLFLLPHAGIAFSERICACVGVGGVVCVCACMCMCGVCLCVRACLPCVKI